MDYSPQKFTLNPRQMARNITILNEKDTGHATTDL